jgi:DNA-binding NtrC family response regulator
MSMRRTARGRADLAVSLRMFGWERGAMATLRHPTLPWFDGFGAEIVLDATPLPELRDLGGRDRLSLVAQFAAHQAFLQFAGISDSECDPGQWAVVRKRGCDVRLIRTAARPSNPDAPPPLTIIQQFAEALAAPPLDVLRQSWARAESVYCEAATLLRRGAAADLRWMGRGALGELASPGPDVLRSLLVERGRFVFRDPSCVDAIRNAAALGSERVVVMGESASPLQRYSAVESLTTLAGPLRDRRESEVVERVVAACAGQRVLFVVLSREAFDPASRNVLQMLQALDDPTWITSGITTGVDAGGGGGPNDGTELPEARSFIISPRFEPRRELESRIAGWPVAERSARLEAFVASPLFPPYLEEGSLPREPAALAQVREPARSYVAALALLGTHIPWTMAKSFLSEFVGGDTNGHTKGDVLVDGVTSLDGETLVFASPEIRDAALQFITPTSRAQLCLVAAKAAEASGDLARAAELLIEAGDPAHAAELFERVTWRSPEESIRALRALTPLTPPLATTLANALLDCGRYRDAREAAPDDVTLARIDRRLGEYSSALARLEALKDPSFEAELLRAELYSLERRYPDARAAFETCRPSTDEERVRLGYARSVLAIECGETEETEWMLIQSPSRAYLASRVETYRCIARDDATAAIEAAGNAIALARTVVEGIDAMLDRLFALFSCGRWEESRSEAMRTLAVIEETQGDRAAGGVLFTLAYLCADDGQWTHAAQRIARLKHFYAGTRDERRLAELDLLAAQLDFARGRFDTARAAAIMILSRDLPPMIREAAALIVDEISTIEGHVTSLLLSTGAARNRELADRHTLLRMRRGLPSGSIGGDFTHALAAWERGLTGRPVPSTGSEWLKLFRSALAKGDRSLAESIAAELGIELERRQSPDAELRLLHAAATRDFPYGQNDLGAVGWRFATRNRLGHWNANGSLPPLEPAELDNILANILASGALDWLAISDRELLFVDGVSRWSAEGRETLEAVVRTRAEQHRLQRILDQEDAAQRAPRSESLRSESVDGIVGQSAVMREVFTLISRVAKRDVPICILGESGTGKELVARAIHRNSTRRHKIFTPVNCAALPETLIESELFGHARGAFTGADRDRAGLIETTDGGTLFLDEIGEMPLTAQAKLLRFLQEGEFRRVGDATSRTADVRIVTATNRKLEQGVEEGRFREDLYYRIRVVEVALAPLRERIADIPLLAAHFLAAEREKHRSGAASFTPEAESVLGAYAWPGNVRELQNTIRAAHALAGEAKAIDLEHLPERVRAAAGARMISSYHDAIARFRRELIERSLAQVMGNQNQAAALLKISRQALAYQIRELGILVRTG